MNRKFTIMISLSLLVSALSFIAMPTPSVSAAVPPAIDGGTVYWNQDWYVDNGTSLEYVNQSIILGGDLQINTTGSLTLRNVTLFMNCSYRMEYNITSYGSFRIFDGDNNSQTISDRSDIASPGLNREFGFTNNPGSILEIRGCNVQWSGYRAPAGPWGGIVIKTSGFVVSDATIIDTTTLPYYTGRGINIYDGCEGSISNCTFMYGTGIVCQNLENSYIQNNHFFYGGSDIIDFGVTQNVTIDGNYFDNFVWAGCGPISLGLASNITISNNQMYNGQNNNRGISLWNHCEKSVIFNNTIDGFTGVGINIDGVGTNNIEIKNNQISNTYRGIYIWTGANHILVDNNEISNCECGIRISSNITHNNTITNNTLTENGVGLAFDDPKDNNIYHNVFVGNTYQANNSGVNNLWDDGYPSGGNYWSDYHGSDSNGDGIGDIPYSNIGGSVWVQDNYPLMEPFGGLPPISNVSFLPTYWLTPSIEINAAAEDDYCVKNVTLWYRYSEDNVSWDAWEKFSTDIEIPWNWTFSFPDESGYYQFYSIAVDNASKYEAAPVVADAACIYNNPPLITLDSPANNSIIPAGTIIDVNISDENIEFVNYTLDSSAEQPLPLPYDINTAGWVDGLHYLNITATDSIGNNTEAFFSFTIDSTYPDISLISPTNNSFIRPGTVIDVSVTDIHLVSVNYSINNGTFQKFNSPYNLYTGGWSDGVCNLTVNAFDVSNQLVSKYFCLNIDGTGPRVVSVSPANNSTNVPRNTSIVVQFNESMNVTTTENAFSIINLTYPTVISYSWNAEKTIMNVTIASMLENNRSYQVSINSSAKDLAGNILFGYSFTFTTWLDSDDDNVPDSQDDDDDNDGTPDSEDDFPFDASENTDSDGDGIGNNADSDDDGDGTPDADDDFPLDPSEDTDTDHDGTGNNADTDDDGDGVPDDIDADPLDPAVTDIIGNPENGWLENYLWLIVILIIIAVIGAILMFTKKSRLVASQTETVPEMRTELCPKCGFDIEKGSPCPFCAGEKPPEPPKPQAQPETKPKLDRDEMLQRVEKAYKEGRMNEEQYRKNLEKFK